LLSSLLLRTPVSGPSNEPHTTTMRDEAYIRLTAAFRNSDFWDHQARCAGSRHVAKARTAYFCHQRVVKVSRCNIPKAAIWDYPLAFRASDRMLQLRSRP